MYPIHVDLSGKEVVVAGGGPVAYRKIRDLLKEKALITVISPEAVSEIQELNEQKKLTWISREIQREDYNTAFLIIAATSSRTVNSELAAESSANQLVNVADQPHCGNFIIPSVVKRGKLLLSVSTSGASPSLSISIKKDLQQRYSNDYESYLDFLFECRTIIKREIPQKNQKRLLKQLTDAIYLHEEESRELYKQTLLNKTKHKLAAVNQIIE